MEYCFTFSLLQSIQAYSGLMNYLCLSHYIDWITINRNLTFNYSSIMAVELQVFIIGFNYRHTHTTSVLFYCFITDFVFQTSVFLWSTFLVSTIENHSNQYVDDFAKGNVYFYFRGSIRLKILNQLYFKVVIIAFEFDVSYF